MLKQRIIATLRFFALQEVPLTLFELHKYLLADLKTLKRHLNDNWEVTSTDEAVEPTTINQVLSCLETQCQDEVKSFRGYYYLSDKDNNFVTTRLHNYSYGIFREQLIKKHTLGLRRVPFLRSIGLVGSQAFGLPRVSSDIDTLIIVEPSFMWLARFFVTLYFQLAGVRRHGHKIANRFCLNHYISGPKTLDLDRNLYTAAEYIKARPIYHAGVLAEFKRNNLPWLQLFFPNTILFDSQKVSPSLAKRILESLFNNKFGRWLEHTVGAYQLRRINRSEFVVVEADELSFHPDNRKAQLFAAFFER